MEKMVAICKNSNTMWELMNLQLKDDIFDYLKSNELLETIFEDIEKLKNTVCTTINSLPLTTERISSF